MSNLYPYEILKIDKKNYLYNFNTNGIFEVEDYICEVLNSGTDIENKLDKETIKFLEDNYILRTVDNEKILKQIYKEVLTRKMSMKPRSLVLMITQQCNLRCIYCYGVNGEYNHKGIMDEKIALKSVDYFLQYAYGKHYNICFFGGEPLLNFKVIKAVVAYARELEERQGITFGFSMTTNATLINEEIEEFIIKNRINTTISIDGTKETHDSNRFYSDHKGCYDNVIKNTQKLRKSGLLIARMTVSSKNLNIFDNVEHLIDLGFKEVAWALALNLIDKNDIDYIIKEQNKLVKRVEDCIKAEDYVRAKKYTTIYRTLKKFSTDGISTKGCGAGNNIMTINIDGNVYPCHRFVGDDKMKLGNINSAESCYNPEFYENIGVGSFKQCENCIARNTCAGGCVNENYEYCEDLKVSPYEKCKYYKALTKECLQLYLKLNDTQKKYLFDNN